MTTKRQQKACVHDLLSRARTFIGEKGEWEEAYYTSFDPDAAPIGQRLFGFFRYDGGELSLLVVPDDPAWDAALWASDGSTLLAKFSQRARRCPFFGGAQRSAA